MASVISILVAHPFPLACELMADALRSCGHQLKPVHLATDSEGVLAGLEEKQPRIALISVALQDGRLAGLHLLCRLREQHPKTYPILLLDAPDPKLVVEAFRCGARGIYYQTGAFAQLCKCIHAVWRGQIWATSQDLEYLLETLAGTPAIRVPGGGAATPLTKREAQVVSLVGEGLTNRAIAQHLNLSEHTVRNYLFRVFEKLRISSRVELVRYCMGPANRAQKREAVQKNLGPRSLEPAHPSSARQSA